MLKNLNNRQQYRFLVARSSLAAAELALNYGCRVGGFYSIQLGLKDTDMMLAITAVTFGL